MLAIAVALVGLPASAAATGRPPIKHVFVLIDENESASTTFGPNSPAPYLSKTLVYQGAFVSNYYGIGHHSLDNYIAMVSGQAPNPSTSGDCPYFVDFPADSRDASGQENGQGCVYPTDVPTLMSQLDGARLTWRAYEDSMGADPSRESATCGHPALGAADNTQRASATDQYATRHDPFVYFHYVIDNQAECDADVVNLDRLSADLGSVATTPNFTFITPSLCNDGHDATCANGGPGGLAQADAFLRKWVPLITSSPAFKQDGLLIITFDEASGDASACCGEAPGPFDASNGIMPGGSGPGGGRVGAVLLSRFIAPGTTSANPYNHYSLLASIEDIFGLPRLAAALGTTPFGADIFTRPNGPALTRAQLIAALAGQMRPQGMAARISSLLRSHAYVLRFRAPEAGRAAWTWAVTRTASGHAKAKTVLVARGTRTFNSSGLQTVKLTLTHAGITLLRGKRQAKLTAKVVFTPTGGEAVEVSRTFTLQR